MKKNTILILCFLGDPLLPAGSLNGTGGFNASAKDLLNLLLNEPEFNCVFITNTTGNYNEKSFININSNIILYRLFTTAENLLNKNNYTNEIVHFQTEIKKIVKDFSNIAFMHSFYWLSGLIASELSTKYNIPFIHTTVSLAEQKEMSGHKTAIINQRKMENTFLHNAKYVLAITEEEKRILINNYNIEKGKIIVEGQSVAQEFHKPIYNEYGIPNEFMQKEKLVPIGFNQLNIVEDDWWSYGAFTYVGRVTKDKGLDIIIKAWIELDTIFDGKIPPLWIVGNSPYEIEDFRLKSNISRHILNEYEQNKRITWWGYLNASAISTLYLKTAVLVTHSSYEAGGRVILEAMCQGIPVISTNTGFGKDYIVNWSNGFIVDYNDFNTLLLRMSHFVANPVLSSVLGENARKTFQKIENNWNHNTRMKVLYKTLINNDVYVDGYTPNAQIDNSIFDQGQVSTYPYFYHNPTIKDIINYLKKYTQNGFAISTTDLKQTISNNFWEYNNTFVIKNIYPKLNKRKIWDLSEVNNVWSTNEILDKYNYTVLSSSVLPPININKAQLLILLPYIEMLSFKEFDKNIYNIANLIKKFSMLNIPSQIKGTTFIEYWNNLQNNINKLSIPTICKIYESIPSNIKIFLSESTNFDHNICLQYAQFPLPHVGKYKGTLVLLPTYHWRCTENGLDAGLLYSEILLSKNILIPTELLHILKRFSNIWEIPEVQILSWCLCIFLEKMLCNTIFNKSYDNILYSKFIYIINLFKFFI